MSATTTLKTTRVRPGLYSIATWPAPSYAPVVWTVEEREVDPGYGGGWAWFASSDDGGVLDPLPRLRDVKAAIAAG